MPTVTTATAWRRRDAHGEPASRSFLWFSEVFEFDVPTMKRWANAGVRFALTWDELSPLLGVDPQDMVAAIRAIGPEHFMLSSDAGIPLLPQTVEAYRLLAAMLRAYGMTEIEMRQLMTGGAKEMLRLS